MSGTSSRTPTPRESDPEAGRKPSALEEVSGTSGLSAVNTSKGASSSVGRAHIKVEVAGSSPAYAPNNPHHMEWSAHLERLRALRDQGLTVTECAKVYGVTRNCMAKVFSRYCLNAECIERLEKDRRLVRRYRVNYGWSVQEIAEHLERSKGFVSRELKRHGLTWQRGMQLDLLQTTQQA